MKYNLEHFWKKLYYFIVFVRSSANIATATWRILPLSVEDLILIRRNGILDIFAPEWTISTDIRNLDNYCEQIVLKISF